MVLEDIMMSKILLYFSVYADVGIVNAIDLDLVLIRMSEVNVGYFYCRCRCSKLNCCASGIDKDMLNVGVFLMLMLM